MYTVDQACQIQAISAASSAASAYSLTLITASGN